MKIEGRNLIILNAASTYGRTLLVMAMSLVSVRWVLVALGQEDFGLFAVVGGIIVLLSMLSSVMVGGATRFFAYSIGQRNPEETQQWFCSAIAVQGLLVLLLLLVGIPLWDGLLKWFLTIPPDRLSVCRFVYYFSLLGASVTFMSSPYIGMFTAKQRVFELSAWGVGQGLFTCGLAYSLLVVHGDKLLLYSGGMVLCIVLVSIGQSVRAMSLFPECRIRTAYLLDFARAKQLALFSGWIVFGVSGGLARSQGMAVLLNVYRGPLMNSALGIANQVAGAAGQMSQAVYSAMSPEITSREGAGNRDGMISLSIRACKFATILGCLWTIPLVATMDFVLSVWLKNPPQYAATFCRIVLIANLVETLTVGYMGAVMASGRIAGYQMSVGCSLILTLPIAWFLLAFGVGVEWAVGAMLLTSTLCTLARVWWAKRLFGVGWTQWVRAVLIPVCASVLPAATIAAALKTFVDNSLVHSLCVIVVSPLAVLVGFWLWGLAADERTVARQKMMAAAQLGFPGIAGRPDTKPSVSLRK